MERVETRCGVPLETRRERGRACAALAASACAGLLAGLTAAAALRGCGGATPHLDAVMTRDALEGNIRNGIYPEGDWDAGDGAENAQRSTFNAQLSTGNPEPETCNPELGKEKEVWAWRR